MLWPLAAPTCSLPPPSHPQFFLLFCIWRVFQFFHLSLHTLEYVVYLLFMFSERKKKKHSKGLRKKDFNSRVKSINFSFWVDSASWYHGYIDYVLVEMKANLCWLFGFITVTKPQEDIFSNTENSFFYRWQEWGLGRKSIIFSVTFRVKT